MNLDQMLVYQVGNQDARALVRALFLSCVCFGSIFFFLVGLQYQRNSSLHWLVIYDNNDSSIDAVNNDEDLAEAYKEAHRRQEG